MAKEIEVLPWFIAADPDDGLKKDCVLIGTLRTGELISVALMVDEKPMEEE